jgi:hypothetical protein
MTKPVLMLIKDPSVADLVKLFERITGRPPEADMLKEVEELFKAHFAAPPAERRDT